MTDECRAGICAFPNNRRDICEVGGNDEHQCGKGRTCSKVFKETSGRCSSDTDLEDDAIQIGKLETTTPSTSQTSKLEKTTPSPLQTSKLEKTTPSTSQTSKLEKTTPSPLQTSKLEKTTPSPLQTSKLEKTTPSPLQTSKLEKNTPSPLQTTVQNTSSEQDLNEIRNLGSTAASLQAAVRTPVVSSPKSSVSDEISFSSHSNAALFSIFTCSLGSVIMF